MLTAVAELLNIVVEDNELLVVNKPADLVCHPSKNGPLSSLIGRVRLHLGASAAPQLINRLDRETSGLVFIAKTEACAHKLRGLWEGRQVVKEYWSVVHGHPQSEHGVIAAPLGKDMASAVAIKNCVRNDGQPATTEYWVLNRFSRGGNPYALLRLRPQTGRKHQIRIHLAAIGYPIVGDKIYGSDERIYLDFVAGRLSEEQKKCLLLPNHALHCYQAHFAWFSAKIFFFAAAETAFLAFLPPTAFKTHPVLTVPNKIHQVPKTSIISYVY
jgi:23S rRNA pseudouridine1911/1915/1917 synthase